MSRNRLGRVRLIPDRSSVGEEAGKAVRRTRRK